MNRSSKMTAMAVVRTAIMNNHRRISKSDATYTAYEVLSSLEGFGFVMEDTNADENHKARKAKQAKQAKFADLNQEGYHGST